MFSLSPSQVPLNRKALVQDSNLTKLPDELLFTILDLAIPRSCSQAVLPRQLYWWHPPLCPCGCEQICDYTAVKNLALVCQRFHSILLPLLHYEINISAWPGIESGKHFRRLRRDPWARSLFRVLSVQAFDDYNEDPITAEAFGLATEVVSQLTELRCLKIHGKFVTNRDNCSTWYNTFTWTFVRESLLHLRMITHLSLLARYSVIHVKDVLELDEFPSLRKLSLFGIEACTLLRDMFGHTPASDDEFIEAVELGRKVRLSKTTPSLSESYTRHFTAVVLLYTRSARISNCF